MTAATAAQRPTGKQLAAWGVHVYTALGSVLGLLIVLAAIDGNLEFALWLVLASMFVDGTDGFLARQFQVKKHTPGFDGALLDNIVDYLTYVFAAVVLLWVGGYFPDGAWGLVVASLPLLASSYQFCRTDAKTDDHFFLGFPSYWNILAFYAIVMDWSPTTVAVAVVICAVLVFVPIRYVYPSRTEAFWQLNLALAAAWLALYALILVDYPEPSGLLIGLSLIYVAYYAAMSLYLTLRGAARRS